MNVVIEFVNSEILSCGFIDRDYLFSEWLANKIECTIDDVLFAIDVFLDV